ncbi:MAG: ANTAR domain-containing protein [Pseudonocardiaceae bacterium]|nr:ANTAR domain-containing protein [Pseudonocardiaceae bacterium]
MAEAGAVAQRLLAITRDGAGGAGLAGQICRACVDGLDVDGAAISLLTESPSRETLCATDATAARVEELQFTLGEGACVEAATTGRPVLVPDVWEASREGRWPVFAAAVAEQTAVRALFALPLQLGTINLGVLDLYRTTPGTLAAAGLRDAMRAADTAAGMLLGLRTDPGDGQWWDQSWASHAEVHQATGMVIAQLGVDAEEAFARLRAYAFSQDRLLGDVARDVVARRLRFSDEMA